MSHPTLLEPQPPHTSLRRLGQEGMGTLYLATRMAVVLAYARVQIVCEAVCGLHPLHRPHADGQPQHPVRRDVSPDTVVETCDGQQLRALTEAARTPPVRRARPRQSDVFSSITRVAVVRWRPAKRTLLTLMLD